ncbi:MAG TPA: PilZ domain-containing protein [Symbiobacteriaceae bacterium]|nr:PilZ domain-containing protein [Symbiobacteriaceae bacterium]
MSLETVVASRAAAFRHLRGLLGQPVRITLVDQASRERVCRFPGVLARVTEDELAVETTQLVPAVPDHITVSIEVLAHGILYWGESAVARSGSPRQIVALMPGALQSGQRRQHARVDLEMPASVYLPQSSRTLQAELRDLSAGGTSLWMHEPLAVAEQVQVAFRMSPGFFLQPVCGAVLRCVMVSQNRFVAGIRFDCPPDQEQAIGAWVEDQLRLKALHFRG